AGSAPASRLGWWRGGPVADIRAAGSGLHLRDHTTVETQGCTPHSCLLLGRCCLPARLSASAAQRNTAPPPHAQTSILARRASSSSPVSCSARGVSLCRRRSDHSSSDSTQSSLKAACLRLAGARVRPRICSD